MFNIYISHLIIIKYFYMIISAAWQQFRIIYSKLKYQSHFFFRLTIPKVAKFTYNILNYSTVYRSLDKVLTRYVYVKMTLEIKLQFFV